VSHIRTGPLSPKETERSRSERVVVALGMAFLRLLALPVADQSATRDVGPGNALHRRLPVRPRMQIRLGAERDNRMHLRCFLRRQLLCLPLVKKNDLVTNVY
jgi:hypothetical protein